MPSENPFPTALIQADEAVLLLVDCQPGLSLAAESRPHQVLVDNVTALVRTANVFDIPVVTTTSATERFSGPVWPAIAKLLPTPPIERQLLNAADDTNVTEALSKTGRSQILIAGVLTEACVAFPAMSLRARGDDVVAVADCCAGTNPETHQLALDRMVATGVRLASWIQLLLEWQLDWTHTATYAGATGVLADFGGAYGLALQHARDMLASPAAAPAVHQ
jgi:nicotinamidase-related amidase